VTPPRDVLRTLIAQREADNDIHQREAIDFMRTAKARARHPCPSSRERGKLGAKVGLGLFNQATIRK
jgi:hypothetical protein